MTGFDDKSYEANVPELDLPLDAYLARAPEVPVRAEFAARVRAALPELPRRRPVVSYAARACLVAAVCLLLALFALAPHAAGVRSFTFYFELLLLVELGGVGYWWARRGQTS